MGQAGIVLSAGICSNQESDVEAAVKPKNRLRWKRSKIDDAAQTALVQAPWVGKDISLLY